MEHTKHIWRAVIVFSVLVTGGLIGRHFLIPSSFGEAGFYRHDSLAEFAAPDPVHGGSISCRECHEDIYDEKMEGKHAAVSCEVCHGPVTMHVENEAKIADMPVDRSIAACAICHLKLAARPKDMPQIAIKAHLIETKAIAANEKPPEAACLTCHKSHDPSEAPD